MKCLRPIVIRRFLCISSFVCFSASLIAQAGPPFLTDDPETPGNGHLLINFGLIGERNRQAGSYQTPDLDLNYGLGPRIQLRYEVPFAIAEIEPNPAEGIEGNVVAGPGSSLLGTKFRFYEHHGKQTGSDDEKSVNFSVSIYPQLALSPGRSVARKVVEPGPDFLLPLEANGRLGPIRIDGEVGYHFGNHSLAQRWIRGLVVGHEFSDRLEAYLELYDEQDANRIYSQDKNGELVRMPKERKATLDIGGRFALKGKQFLLLQGMGGRSFQQISADNTEPNWIAYVGIQLKLGQPDSKN